jgi:anionic cell wall polymer biosynthesis LytR-Cps2A-Psr (LCP) family protein
LGIGLLTGVFLIKGQGQPNPLPSQLTAAPSPSATSEPAPTELRYLFIALISGDQKIVAATVLQKSASNETLNLINVDPETQILLNGRLVKLSDAGLSGSFDGVDSAVSLALRTPIEGAVYLQRLALAGLADSVGGITVQAAQNYLVSEPGKPALYVPQGSVLIAGEQAAGFAMVKVPTESTADFMNRTDQVLRAVFESMPADKQRVEEIFSALGSLARSNIPTSSVAQMLVAIKENNLWPNALITRALVM